MGSAKQDPYRVTGDLIANAIDTAKVFGENRRISNLIAGSVGRFMAEMEDGDALLLHAFGCISDEDAEYLPELRASLQSLSARHT